MKFSWKKWVMFMSNKLKGTGAVFGFTLKQMMKNRANQIIFAIFILVALLAIPVGSLILGDQGADNDTINGYYTEWYTVEDYLAMQAEWDEMDAEVGMDTKFLIQYVYSIAVMVVGLFSVSYIVQGIVMEKSSRLVETLLISVEPMALVFGKILAVMAYIFSMMASMVAAGLFSWKVSGLFLNLSGLTAGLESLGITKDVFRLEPMAWIVIIVSLVLAYLFFSFIAGLTGAGCSNPEEMESANMGAMVVILFGYLVSCMASAFESNMAQTIFALVPAVSSFTVPVFYILEEISLGTVVASWTVELACILFLWWMTASVYQRLILYKGRRMKWGQIISMAMKKEGGK